MSGSRVKNNSNMLSPTAALLAVAFGAYLLYGAYQSISAGRWPGYMPPQLDGLALLSELFSSKAAAYIAGTIAALLGTVCIALGIMSVVQSKPKADGESSDA